MSDSSSGRNNLNAGSDSAKHHTGTASEQHARATSTGPATPITNRHVNGAVGNGTPPAAPERPGVRS